MHRKALHFAGLFAFKKLMSIHELHELNLIDQTTN